MAVKPIVQPWHKWARDQQSDATVVQFAKQLANTLWVAVDCVERKGEAQADDSPSEEGRKHQLLL